MIHFTNELKTENVPQKHMLGEFTKSIVAMIRIKKTFKNTFTKQSMRIVLKKGKQFTICSVFPLFLQS